MEQAVERPRGLGFVPKLIVIILAVIGLFSIVGWLMSFVFSIAKVGLFLAAVVLIGLFVLSRFSPPDKSND